MNEVSCHLKFSRVVLSVLGETFSPWLKERGPLGRKGLEQCFSLGVGTQMPEFRGRGSFCLLFLPAFLGFQRGFNSCYDSHRCDLNRGFEDHAFPEGSESQ